MSNLDIDLVLAKRIVNFMNSLIELDKDAIVNLVNARMVCNKALAEHPTVQVTGNDDMSLVGIIGILNGLCGIYDNGFGAIAAVTDNNGIQRFSFLVPDGDKIKESEI